MTTDSSHLAISERKPLYVQVVTQPALQGCWAVNISETGIGLIATPRRAGGGAARGRRPGDGLHAAGLAHAHPRRGGWCAGGMIPPSATRAASPRWASASTPSRARMGWRSSATCWITSCGWRWCTPRTSSSRACARRSSTTCGCASCTRPRTWTRWWAAGTSARSWCVGGTRRRAIALVERLASAPRGGGPFRGGPGE